MPARHASGGPQQADASEDSPDAHDSDRRVVSHDPPVRLAAASPISVAEATAFKGVGHPGNLVDVVLVHLPHVQFEPADDPAPDLHSASAGGGASDGSSIIRLRQ